VVHIETRSRPFLFADTDFDAALHAGTPQQLATAAPSADETPRTTRLVTTAPACLIIPG
jgi:hypothetical protein